MKRSENNHEAAAAANPQAGRKKKKCPNPSLNKQDCNVEMLYEFTSSWPLGPSSRLNG